MLGEHREVLRGEQRGRAAAGHHRHGDPGLLEQRQRVLEEIPRVRIAVGERHETLKAHPRQPYGPPGEVERLVRGLHAGAPEPGVALHEESDVDTVVRPGLGQLVRHHVVVEDDRQPAHALDQRHEPIRLRPAEDVVGEEDVVGDAGVHEDLHLAELLARDPDGAGLDLHPPDRGDLVGLDVRPVADLVA